MTISFGNLSDLGNQIEVLTVGDGSGSGEEEEESVPVCSMGRDVSADDVCADAAVAPMQPRGVVRRDLSPTQVNVHNFSHKTFDC